MNHGYDTTLIISPRAYEGPQGSSVLVAEMDRVVVRYPDRDLVVKDRYGFTPRITPVGETT